MKKFKRTRLTILTVFTVMLIAMIFSFASFSADEPCTSHDFGHWQITKEETCSEEGVIERSCNICGFKERKGLVKSPHTVVIDEAVDPTCEKQGKTQGSHCSVCCEVIVRQTAIKALNHKGGVATCVKLAVCERCGEQYGKLNPNRHEHTEFINGVVSDCSHTGLTDGERCLDCKVFTKAQKETLKKAHNYKITLIKATVTNDGKEVYVCENCGSSFERIINKASQISVLLHSFAYDGKEKKTEVKIVDSKGENLRKDVDYKLSFSNNKAIGTASCKITFMGKYGGTKTVNYKILPANVKISKITPTTNSIKFSWDKVQGADGYRVYRYDTSKKAFVKVKDIKGTSFTLEKLKKGTKYTISVRAYKKVGDKTYLSESYGSKVTATKPSPPETPTITAGSKKVTLSWKKVSGVTGYQIYYSTKKDGTYKFAGYTPNLSYTVSKLNSGTTYYFKIRTFIGCESNVYSSYSPIKSVKVK